MADTLIENGVATSRIRIAYRGPTPGFEALESRRVEVRVDPNPPQGQPAAAPRR